MAETPVIKVQFPEKFRPLLTSHKRFKVAVGGRGGGKSTSIATWLLIRALQSKIRIYCTREIQKSIDESVHALLSKRIREIEFFKDKFEIQSYKIIACNGSEILKVLRISI